MNFTERLREMLGNVKPDENGYVSGYHSALLEQFLRNNAEALLRVVQAADKLVSTPTMIVSSEAQRAFMELRESLRALDGAA